MVDMGVPNYLVASSVIGIMAQRLVRVVCARCKQPLQMSQAVIEDAGFPAEMLTNTKFMKGKGCSYCTKSGYRGRLAMIELMPVTSKIRELIFKNVPSDELRREAIKLGMKTLYMDGLAKVCQGITTLEEVYRSAKRTEQDKLVA
jgi:type IV pilus assembly protein PilB